LKASSDKFLIVFAGPNGAGKSFASQTYLKNLGVSNSAFDWDERFLNLWRQYDFDPMVHSGVRDRINEEFGDYIQQGFKIMSTWHMKQIFITVITSNLYVRH
jgi:predicted ABC-type ATPase